MPVHTFKDVHYKTPKDVILETGVILEVFKVRKEEVKKKKKYINKYSTSFLLLQFF